MILQPRIIAKNLTEYQQGFLHLHYATQGQCLAEQERAFSPCSRLTVLKLSPEPR